MDIEKHVVLFGRTGAGKSTIANALVEGGLDRAVFKSSDAAAGCTAGIQTERGRNWVVTDTPGLGEGEQGTMSHEKARKMLVDYLKDVRGTYSHIIYVQKAKRITEIDETIWKIFGHMFQGGEGAFVVIFTGESIDWLTKNRNLVPAYLKDQTILVSNIPPLAREVRPAQPAIDRRNDKIRERSIEKLQNELIDLFEQRGRKRFTPDIAKMDEEQLNSKARSLMKYIADCIKKIFKKDNWMLIASNLRLFVDVFEIYSIYS